MFLFLGLKFSNDSEKFVKTTSVLIIVSRVMSGSGKHQHISMGRGGRTLSSCSDLSLNLQQLANTLDADPTLL